MRQANGNADTSPGRIAPSGVSTLTGDPGARKSRSISERPTLRSSRGDHAAEVIRPKHVIHDGEVVHTRILGAPRTGCAPDSARHVQSADHRCAPHRGPFTGRERTGLTHLEFGAKVEGIDSTRAKALWNPRQMPAPSPNRGKQGGRERLRIAQFSSAREPFVKSILQTV